MGSLVTGGGALGTSAASNPTDFQYRTQTFFNPKLLKALQFNLKLAGYGLSQGYSTIGDTIRFFRPRKASLSYTNAEASTASLSVTAANSPTSYAEGVTPTNLTEVAVGYVDILLTQRAGIAKISDKLQAIDLLNTLKVYSETMGQDAALDYDSVIRNALVNSLFNVGDGVHTTGSDDAFATGNDGGYFERFAGVVNTGDSSVDFNTLSGLSKSNAKMTRAVNLGVVTQLKTSKIPKIGGQYVAVTPPQVIHDMRQDTTWTQTGTFQDKQMLFKDLAMMLDGCAFVEANNPWIEGATYGTESSTDPGDGLIYSTIYLGAEAFGIPNLSNKIAGGSQAAPRIVILNQPDKYDPLNQVTVIGWKAFFGAKAFITSLTPAVGERPHYAILRTKSTFA